MLLPRRLLPEAARRNEPDDQVAAHTYVTADMARMRMNVSGARMEAARTRQPRR